MNADSLQKGLEAIMASDIPDEDKDAMSKALASDFANDTSEVSDLDAVDGMPEDVATAYNSAETKPEDKAANLKAAKIFMRKAEARVVLSAVKAGKTTVNSNKDGGKGNAADDTATTLRALTDTIKGIPALVTSSVNVAVDKLKTEGIATLGAPAAKINGQQTREQGGGKSNDFFAQHVQPLILKGVKRPDALSAAKRANPKEFAEWQAGQHNRR